MSILTLDCETLPLASSLAAPYPAEDRLPPSNYKNPEAIASWREKDVAAWQESRVKECSLTPRLGRIACLGMGINDAETQIITASDPEDETQLLTWFWNSVRSGPQLVTFNGAFDLRFIAIRSAILSVPGVPLYRVGDWFRRYSTSPHFDCRAVLTGWDDRQSGKLSEWCASFGIPSTDTTSGADVYALAQAGQWDAIAAHCRHDVEQTRALYRKISPLFT